MIYRPGRIHVVPDALSRLQGAPTDRAPHEENLNLHAYHGDATTGTVPASSYHTILVELSQDFKNRLVDTYADDKHWARIMDLVLKSQARCNHNAADQTAVVQYSNGNDPMDGDEYNSLLGLRFFERHGLLYFRDFENGRDRLYVPAALKKEVFEHAHDNHHH